MPPDGSGNRADTMGDALELIRAHREVTKRPDPYGLWVRRFFMALLTALIVLALLNVFGQRATDAVADNSAATLRVHSPTTVRGGLLFQAKITITAKESLPGAQLILSHGWIDGLTQNTQEPSPSNETSGPGGSLVFDIGSLNAGQSYTQYLEYQVNPTSIGERPQSVVVKSKGATIVSLRRTMAIVP